MPENSVHSFAEECSIPWSCGYQAPLRTIALWGAFDRAKMIPGYEVTPTLYVIGRDGRIAWCDRHARTRHDEKEQRDEVLGQLEAAIERALTAPDSTADGGVSRGGATTTGRSGS